MPHPLVLALYDSVDAAAAGVRAARDLGIAAEHVSLVARSHQEESELAERLGGSPGVEMEDSRAAARIGELGAQVVAAIALVMPGIGPIVTAGPLAAELGEAAGHAAGSLASVLGRAGVSAARALEWQRAIEGGAVLVGVHVMTASADAVEHAFARSHARDIEVAEWQ